LQWFSNILRQQQVLHFYRIGTTAIHAMEDAVHRIHRPVIWIFDRDSNVAYYYRCHQSDWDRHD